jgi:CheY-like chemotaxis protein
MLGGTAELTLKPDGAVCRLEFQVSNAGLSTRGGIMAELLDGRRILVVEDEPVVALDMSDIVEEFGGVVVGPVGQLAHGLALAESEELAGAILDVNLGGESSFALADRLFADGVPVILATGYGTNTLPERFVDFPQLAKPFSAFAVERTFQKIFAPYRHKV